MILGCQVGHWESATWHLVRHVASNVHIINQLSRCHVQHPSQLENSRESHFTHDTITTLHLVCICTCQAQYTCVKRLCVKQVKPMLSYKALPLLQTPCPTTYNPYTKLTSPCPHFEFHFTSRPRKYNFACLHTQV